MHYSCCAGYIRHLAVKGLRKEFSRPGKSWKMTVVMESHGIPPIGHGIF